MTEPRRDWEHRQYSGSLFDRSAHRTNEAAAKPSIREVRQQQSSSEANRRKMVERLRQGPLSTYECERLVHRGQAVIGDLRNRGYQIETKYATEGTFYVLLGKVDVVKAKKSHKEAYYSTSHWRRLSALRREFDGYSCKQCGATQDLNVHHWAYDLFKEDIAHDLITLCRSCHMLLHERISGSKVHFPENLEVDVARRLENGG